MDKAVILAAGKGKRLRAVTGETPKPLLHLAGRPMLIHVLDRLREAGVRQFLIVVGYGGHLIRRALAGYPAEVRFTRQRVLDGTATAALLAREFTGSDPFLLSYADILVDPSDWVSLARLLAEDASASGVVGVKYVEDPWQGAAVYEDSGVLTAIIEKPPPGTSSTHWNSAGLYAFRPSVYAALERVPVSPRGEYELTSALSLMIASGERLLLGPVRGQWRDVGRPEDVAAAEDILRRP